MNFKLPAASLLCCFVFACQSPVGEAKSAFDEARYADAAVAFRSIQRTDLAPEDLARLELYAGLTHLALGDLGRAVPELSRARRAFEACTSCFTPAEQGRLLSAWSAIGRMPGQALLQALGD